MALNRITVLLTVGLLALGEQVAPAAEPPGRIEVHHYGTDSGMDNTDIHMLLEDREGFVWASTADAVYRSDGGRFERFDSTAGVPSTIVTDMTLDARGQVMLATSEGVIRWEGQRFLPVSTRGLPSRALGLRLDPHQRLWVGTAQGLYVEDSPGHFSPAPGWPGGPALQLWMDASGELQVLSETQLLGQQNAGGWRPLPLPGHPGVLSALARDGHGRLWVSAEGWLAMQPHPGASLEEHSELLQGLRGAGLRLRIGHRGQLQVPHYQGLIEVEGDTPLAHRLSFPERAERMSDVLEDHEGSLWIASLGLHRSLGRDLWSVHDRASGLPSSIIWGLDRGLDGTLWVGTDAGVVYGTAQGWVPIPELKNYSLKVVHLAPDGRLWTAGNPTGLHVYDPRTRRVRTFGAEAGYAPSYSFGLVQEPDGTLWAATSSGLLRGVHVDGTPSFHVELPPADRTSFYSVARDSEGRIWAAGNGLRVREGGVFRRLGRAEGLLQDRVRFILPLRQRDRFCVSYIEPLGLSCFTYRDGRLSEVNHLNRHSGLYNDVIYQLGEDRAGRLWVGTGAGVHVVGTDGSIELFGTNEGAPGDDFNLNSFYADADGTVWTGTTYGLGQFEGARYPGPLEPPRGVLREVRLGSHAFTQAPEPGLELSHDEASLEVRFTNPGAFDEEQLEHQERVVGLDDWHRVVGHTVRYKTLPPGHHRFELRTRRGPHAWGPVVGFDFDVRFAWWTSWWAHALEALLLAAALWGVVRWRGLALRRRNLELERLVGARTTELARAREKVVQAEKLSAMGQLLARLSHEINNPLTAIHNNLPPVREYFELQAEALRRCREQLEGSPEQAAAVARVWREQELDFVLQDTPEALEAMSSATLRIRSIQADLGAFLRGEPLRLEVGDLNQTVRKTVELVRRSLRPSLRVELVCGELPPLAFHDGQMGQVLLNLLRNALDALGEEGVVRVSTAPLVGGVELVVADNGPGIPAELRSRIFEPFFTTKDVGQGSGLGLAICRQIIADHHGGSLELDESVPRGACFRVVLPLIRARREAA